MTDKDTLVRAVLDDGSLMAIMKSDLSYMLRPLRARVERGFDYESITRYEIPDSLDRRAEQLVSNYAHYIVDALLPKLRKEAADEAKHNLIRRLDQVLS